MTDTNSTENTESEEIQLIDSDGKLLVYDDDYGTWYQKNADIAVPLTLIAFGLVQFILRKWIVPVSDETISELEDSFPTQGLYYMPEFGAFFMIIGFILLVAFNLHRYI